MFSKLQVLILTFLVLPVLPGCTPEANRESTKLKSAADVKISVGESSPQPEEEEEVATSESSPSAAPTNSAKADSKVVKTDTDKKVTSETKPKMVAGSKVPPKKSGVTAANSGYTGPPKFYGRVTVTGKAPKFPPLLAKGGATKDAVCAEEAVPNQSVVVSAEGGLADVFVYMKKAPKTGVPEPTGEAPVIDQVGCVFMPHAAIVRIGQTVILKNTDPVAHNVNVKAFQEAYNNVVPAGSSVDHTFRFAERLPASTGCDFHTFMSAWILPINHPWAAITDKDGRFEIPNLPVGKWDFIVWHEKTGYIERSVKVKAAADQAIEINFEVPASKLSQ